MTDNHTRTEEFTINGEELLTRIKDLLRQGNIRRIIIKNKEGHILMELPLTIGVVSVVLAPTLAAIGAIAALLSEATVVVEKSVE